MQCFDQVTTVAAPLGLRACTMNDDGVVVAWQCVCVRVEEQCRDTHAVVVPDDELQTHTRTHAHTHTHATRYTDRRMDGWMDGWVNQPTNQPPTTTPKSYHTVLNVPSLKTCVRKRCSGDAWNCVPTPRRSRCERLRCCVRRPGKHHPRDWGRLSLRSGS